MQLSVVDSLQRAVANSYAMYMNYKRYHGNTFAPIFRDIHLLFDEHSEVVLEEIGEFGERIRILDAESIGSPEEVSKLATVQTAHSMMTMREMIEQAISNHRLIIGEFKGAIRAAALQDDPGSSDLFVRTLQTHERQMWFLREFLKNVR